MGGSGACDVTLTATQAGAKTGHIHSKISGRSHLSRIKYLHVPAREAPSSRVTSSHNITNKTIASDYSTHFTAHIL